MQRQSFEDITSAETSLAKALKRLSSTFLRRDLKRWRPMILAALLITLIAKAFSVAAPVLLGEGINQIQTDMDVFVWAALGYAGCRFLAQGLPQIRDAFFVKVTQDAVRLVAVEAFSHAQSLSLNFHLTRRAGALNRVIERGAGSMEFLLRFLAFNIAPTLIELVLAAAVLWLRYGVWLAVVAVAAVGSYIGFTIWLTEVRTRQRRSVNEADTEVKALTLDSLTNFETVKAFSAEAREAELFDQAIRRYSKGYIKLIQSLSALNAGQELIMNAGLLGVILLAGFAAYSGGLAAGDVTAVILILVNIYRPLNILGFAWREIKQGMVDMEKLFGLMDIKPEIQDREGAIDLIKPEGDIDFKQVSFCHEGRQDGLEELSFTIPGGSYVGIVGASGAGKSTILKLLFRFYDPLKGSISIGGQNLKDVRQISLRTALGLVPQDVVLFNDTLRYNLAYGAPLSSEADIMAAVREARLDDFVARLPMGLETRVGERGLKLSGGEKQRVGVARIILRKPQILILDEATSALDSRIEKEVQLALNAAAKGRTTVSIAHRLSTLKDADYIFVLDQGHVVETGKPKELLSSETRFRRMWDLQDNSK